MPSISFRVPRRLWTAFTEQTDRLFISRAPFLDHMLSIELPRLVEELEGIKLNTRTKRHIANQLTRADPVSVNIDVRRETAEQLREAVKAHNIVRDAFICRLLIFLRARDAFLDALDVPRCANDGGLRGFLEEMPSSPLGAMEAVRDDPLFYIREHLKQRHDLAVYTVELLSGLDWAACYLPPERVPNTGAFNKQQRMWAELLELPKAKKSPTGSRRSK